MVISNQQNLSILSRGGVIIQTLNYPIQMGSPPETIKDTMLKKFGVPRIFIATRNLYNHSKRHTFVEFEFPIYYNTFVRKEKTIIYCTPPQAHILEKMLRLGMFGPEKIDLSKDFPDGVEPFDMKKELEFFTRVPGLPNDLFSFENTVELRVFEIGERTFLPDEVSFTVEDEKLFVFQGGNLLAEVDYDHNPPMIPYHTELVRNPFKPPAFGLTTLGRGHGFDPDEITAGYVIWINRQGILIDPPVSAGDFINDMGIDRKAIRGIILTHCHSDHDSGVLHSLMLESKTDLYTTELIFDIFVNKYSGLVGMKPEEFRNLVNFHPVKIQEPKAIHGAHFLFRYNFHSVPALGFEVHYRGKSMNYSGDHLNCPDRIEEVYAGGFISKQRKEELLNFDWTHDVILHECGIPPIHTPLSTFEKLPKSVKKNLYLYHLSFKNLPEDLGLKAAPGYKEPSIELDVASHPYEEAQEILEVAARVTLFQDFTFSKSIEFLEVVEKRDVEAGEIFIKSGEIGTEFFIIASGKAAVLIDGKKIKTHSKCDYIGETSLILNSKRTADVIALTPLTLLVMSRADFLNFIRDSKVEEKCRRIAEVREKGVWECLDNNWLFSEMTVTQKTQLQGLMHFRNYPEGSLIIDFDDPLDHIYLIRSGKVELSSEDGTTHLTLKMGDLVDDFSEFLGNHLKKLQLVCKEKCEIFIIPSKEFSKFMEVNTGLKVLINTRISSKNSLYASFKRD